MRESQFCTNFHSRIVPYTVHLVYPDLEPAVLTVSSEPTFGPTKDLPNTTETLFCSHLGGFLRPAEAVHAPQKPAWSSFIKNQKLPLNCFRPRNSSGHDWTKVLVVLGAPVSLQPADFIISWFGINGKSGNRSSWVTRLNCT